MTQSHPAPKKSLLPGEPTNQICSAEVTMMALTRLLVTQVGMHQAVGAGDDLLCMLRHLCQTLHHSLW